MRLDEIDEMDLPILEAAQGHQVTVHGVTFGAQTGHHHAPFVILADQVVVR